MYQLCTSKDYRVLQGGKLRLITSLIQCVNQKGLVLEKPSMQLRCRIVVAASVLGAALDDVGKECFFELGFA